MGAETGTDVRQSAITGIYSYHWQHAQYTGSLDIREADQVTIEENIINKIQSKLDGQTENVCIAINPLSNKMF